MTPEINDTCMFMIIAKDIWDDVHYTYSKAFNRAWVYEIEVNIEATK